MNASFESELADLAQRSLLRRMREIEGRDGTVVDYQGEELINFSSNDYLGLSGESFLREAARRAITDYGVGSGASRLVCGTLTPHLLFEERLAAFKQTEAALSFSSGYAAAVGTLSALATPSDVIILDKLVHASIVDGAKLSGATIRVFPHNHLEKLEHLLQWAQKEKPDARVIIATESVFSMDGDRALLREIVELKDRFGALLLLDEAHAVGILGNNGRGLIERLGLEGRVEIQMGTMSKALGVSGGYICGSRVLIDLLTNRARSFIYSTAPIPAVSAAALASIEFLASADGQARRKLLWDNLNILAAGLPPGLTPERLQSAIVPILLGEEETALQAARVMYENGLFVPAIRYPTVARGAARLRVTLSALHTPEQVVALTETLWRITPKQHPAPPASMDTAQEPTQKPS